MSPLIISKYILVTIVGAIVFLNLCDVAVALDSLPKYLNPRHLVVLYLSFPPCLNWPPDHTGFWTSSLACTHLESWLMLPCLFYFLLWRLHFPSLFLYFLILPIFLIVVVDDKVNQCLDNHQEITQIKPEALHLCFSTNSFETIILQQSCQGEQMKRT